MINNFYLILSWGFEEPGPPHCYLQLSLIISPVTKEVPMVLNTWRKGIVNITLDRRATPSD